LVLLELWMIRAEVTIPDDDRVMYLDAPNCPTCLQRLSAEGTEDAPYRWCSVCSRPATFRADADGGTLIDLWP